MVVSVAGSPHRWPVRVYYEDTDAGGIVYYANYLKFAERARTEWLRSLGLGKMLAPTTDGILFVVRALRVDYLSPARLDDALEVRTRLCALGGSRLELEQTVFRDEVALTVLEVTLVAVGPNGRAMRLSADVRAACEAVLCPPPSVDSSLVSSPLSCSLKE